MWAAWALVALLLGFAVMHNPWRPWVAYQPPVSSAVLTFAFIGFLVTAAFFILMGASPTTFAGLAQRLIGE